MALYQVHYFTRVASSNGSQRPRIGPKAIYQPIFLNILVKSKLKLFQAIALPEFLSFCGLCYYVVTNLCLDCLLFSSRK